MNKKNKNWLQETSLKITNKVTSWHHKLFTFLINKSKKVFGLHLCYCLFVYMKL